MALLDQCSDRRTAPQRKRQAKRVWQMATDQIPHLSLLTLIYSKPQADWDRASERLLLVMAHDAAISIRAASQPACGLL